MRRKGYAEREYEAIIRRKKKESTKQKLFVAGALAIFGGLIAVLYWGIWMWANGYIGG